MKSGYVPRDVINKLNSIQFGASDELPMLGALRIHAPVSHHNLALYLECSGAPSALAESPRHRLAALIYQLVSGLGQELRTMVRNYAIDFRRAHAGTQLHVPRVAALLADPAFRPLDDWLRQRKADGGEVQVAVDRFPGSGPAGGARTAVISFAFSCAERRIAQRRLGGGSTFDLKARNGMPVRFEGLRLAAGERVNPWPVERQERTIMTTMAIEREPASALFVTEADRWAAVVRRDPAADTVFYYSVRTTGVYCQPSCAARRPRRENVLFHPTCAAAEAAGFRSCKRCRPSEASLAERRASAVAEACRLIQGADPPLLGLDALAASVGMSCFHFHRVFKAITGLTPKGFATAHRADRVRDELTRSATVTDAIYGAGFSSQGRFYAASSEVLGMTPTDFRSGGTGTAIRFAVGECSLGAILVAATDKGVCAILLGDDPETLVRDLEDRFPKARLIGGDTQFEQLLAQVVGFIEAPALGLDLPLDVRGTAFQHRVWQALREILTGSTTSYSEIAERIGAPKAVRAVAQACASNAIAVAIPCHRVVRNDGGLSGYRWGVERKRALLDRESVS